MLAFFSLSALDVLNMLDATIANNDNNNESSDSKRLSMIEWIYSHQIPVVESNKRGQSNKLALGFRGSSCLGHKYNGIVYIYIYEHKAKHKHER